MRANSSTREFYKSPWPLRQTCPLAAGVEWSTIRGPKSTIHCDSLVLEMALVFALVKISEIRKLDLTDDEIAQSVDKVWVGPSLRNHTFN